MYGNVELVCEGTWSFNSSEFLYERVSTIFKRVEMFELTFRGSQG